ncbi:MAG: sulfatase-like hydrolase/transferase [Pseudomonadota bacterium]
MQYLLVLFLYFLIPNLLTRLVLFSQEIDLIQKDFVHFIGIILVGFYNDLLCFSYYAIVPALYLLLAPRKWTTKKAHRFVLYGIFFFTWALFIFQSFCEWYFWDEFHSRFNFIAVDYLIYTKEIVGNAKEYLPMPIILTAILFMAAIAFSLTWPLSRKAIRILPTTGWRKKLPFLIPAAFLPLLSFFILGNFFQNISSNTVINHLSKNGLYELCSAFRHNKLDYYQFYRTLENQKVLEIMKKELARKDAQIGETPSHLIFNTLKVPGLPKKLNLVMIVMESMGSKFLGIAGNKQGLTPYLDQLSKKSLYFSNVYATGTRTVRGLEALALSLPPTPGYSILKRPNNENLFSIGKVLKDAGRDNQFIYGGYRYFDNMNYFFSHNNFSVLDRNSFNASEIHHATIWGICDGDVFDRTLQEIDLSVQKKTPFFKLIMTTSNHQPYTYPDGLIDIPSKKGREGGVKYTDYAIGKFLEIAETKPWFKDTLFVIVSDHGVGGRGTTAINVSEFHIPFMIYAPHWIKPKEIKTIAGQIDVAPTILAAMGISYKSRFIGKNIMAMAPAEERFLSATYQKLGYFRQGTLVVLSPMKGVHYFNYDVNTLRIDENAYSNETLLNEAISYYQYASLLMNEHLYYDP